MATQEKIDHVFATVSWEDAHASAFLSALSSSVSDHCPLLLDLNAEFWAGKCFKFEAFWIKKEDFKETVAAAWESLPSAGNPFKVLDNKLCAMAKALQKWSDRWFGNIKMQIAIATKIIYRLDLVADTRVLEREKINLRRLLKKKLLGLSSLERMISWQHSRLLWLREADANTQFFHLHASHRQRRNTITTMTCNGQVVMGHDDIANAVDTYYAELLGRAFERQFSLDLDCLDLPTRDLSHLDVEFSPEEVFKIIKSMPLDKAQGPDGFTGRFYYVYWDVIQHDFMRALEYFHRADARGM